MIYVYLLYSIYLKGSVSLYMFVDYKLKTSSSDADFPVNWGTLESRHADITPYFMLVYFFLSEVGLSSISIQWHVLCIMLIVCTLSTIRYDVDITKNHHIHVFWSIQTVIISKQV